MVNIIPVVITIGGLLHDTTINKLDSMKIKPDLNKIIQFVIVDCFKHLMFMTINMVHKHTDIRMIVQISRNESNGEIVPRHTTTPSSNGIIVVL